MIIIVGAGLAGLSTAYHLRGLPYKVFEKESEAGGLCRSYVKDGFTFDYTGHLLHFRQAAIKTLVETLLPGRLARHARRYGGLLVFSGGVIGPPGTPRNYEGSLADTPVFLGCSDVDPHIPLERVQETAVTFTNLGAQVMTKIYPRMGHTIIQDEIEQAREIARGVLRG